MNERATEIFNLGWFRDYHYKPIKMTDEQFDEIRNKNDEKIMLHFNVSKEEAIVLQDEACSIADIVFT